MFRRLTQRRTNRRRPSSILVRHSFNRDRRFARQLAFEPLEDRRLLTVSYTITDLGTLPSESYSTANSINAGGQVVGQSSGFTTAGHAILYSAGTMQDLGTLPGGARGSTALAINSSGQVVGISDTASGNEHAFLASGGAMQDLGTLPGGRVSYGLGINDSGQVVGEAQTASGQYDAFLYSGGTMHDLGTLGGPYSSAIAINASGEIAGDADVVGPIHYTHAYLYSDGTMHDLGTLPGGTYSTAYGINASGQVVGFGDTGHSDMYAFLYSSGTMHDLGTLPGGTQSLATGINSSGQVVGYNYMASGSQHAFLYAGGAMLDLNSLVDPSSGWILSQANAINDAGQIVGYGISPSGQGGAFLLTPVAPSAPGPQVTSVQVDGTSWSSGFLGDLKTAGLGNGSGYAIPVAGAAQLTNLPWINLNQIQIQFNENVNVQENSLTVAGINVAQYTFKSFSYNSATHTATWTLASPIGADKLSLDLKSTGPDAVTDMSGGPLAGASTNGASAYPSGTGAASGDFNFALNVLPGDVNQGAVVNGQAIAVAASHWLQVGGTAGDVNGDGIVNALDIAAIASHWTSALPGGGTAGSGETSGGAGESIGTSAAAESVSAGGSSASGSPAADATSSAVTTSATSLVVTSAAGLLPSTGPSFTSPPASDHTAAFIGRLDTTKGAAVFDSVMSQHVSALGPSQLAVSSTARQLGKSPMSLPIPFGSSSDAATVSSTPAATVDEDLLDTLAVGRRFDRM